MTCRRLCLLLFLVPSLLWAQEDVLPNGTRSVVNQDCTTSTAHGTLDDLDPESPDGDWCNASSNADTALTIQFASPSGDLSTGADAQTFWVYVRKDTVSAPGSGAPLLDLDAYDATSLIQAQSAAHTVTSDSGQAFSTTWTSNTSDGSGIEVFVDCQEAAGGPNQRSCDFDAVQWVATLVSGEEMMIIGQIKRADEVAP